MSKTFMLSNRAITYLDWREKARSESEDVGTQGGERREGCGIHRLVIEEFDL